jgi:hypothetical protein
VAPAWGKGKEAPLASCARNLATGRCPLEYVVSAQGLKKMKRLITLVAVLVLASHCGSTSSGGGGPPDSGPTSGFNLVINNFEAWCVVTVDSAPLSASATYNFDAGTVVNLHAEGAATFTFDFWTNTNNNTDNSTTVTMTSDKNVLACCDNATEHCPAQ